MIKSIASGSSGNAHIVGNQILLDCGVSLDTLRKHLGNLTKLSGCLVTHEHGDHAKSARGLMRAGVEVYMDQPTIDKMELDHHRLHTVYPISRTYVIGEWRVKGFPLVHDSAGGTGYLLQKGDYKIAYITDTRMVQHNFKGLTHLLVEANYSWNILRRRLREGETNYMKMARVLENHLSLRAAKILLKNIDRSKLREIRLLHLSENNSNRELFKREVEEEFGIPVKVPERRSEC